MRIVAVDFGGKRIGIAVGESEHGIASPRPNLAASGTLARDAMAIAEIAKRELAGLVVVGLPMDADGETKMAKVCRKLGEQIEKQGLKVDFVDESYTSAEAEQEMIEAGLKGSERRARSDAEAACRILERFIDRTS